MMDNHSLDQINPVDQKSSASMRSWLRLTKPEIFLLAAAFCVWIALLSLSAPPIGSTDVYCFRDPAINFLHHQGFRTASYVLSQSFQPVLYSINTPGSSWAYMPFALVFGDGPRSAQLYALALAFLADIALGILILRLFRPGRSRFVFFLLLAAVAPLGVIDSQLDRPENLSFLVLIAILLIVRKRSLSRFTLAGLLSGLAFLVEPVAGVWAAGLTAGAILFQVGDSTLPARDLIRKLIQQSALALVCFFIPIVLTIAGYYLADHTSISRFLHHTDYVLARGAAAEPSATHVATPELPGKAAFFKRYLSAIHGTIAMGLGTWIQVGGFIVTILAWLVLCVSKGVDRRPRFALVLLGIMLLALPVIVFPQQRNYLILSCCLFPFAVACNWCGSGAFANRRAIKIIIVANLLVLCPTIIRTTAHAIESGASYTEAQAQAQVLQSYLKAHHYDQGVVLVPVAQYYLYKPLLSNLYNPFYLSPLENPADVVAVVNCNTGTLDFKSAGEPLPDFVAGQHYHLISSGQQQLHVTLFHHPIMARNWTWSCDVYAK
jgi:hypothetical protein